MHGGAKTQRRMQTRACRRAREFFDSQTFFAIKGTRCARAPALGIPWQAAMSSQESGSVDQSVILEGSTVTSNVTPPGRVNGFYCWCFTCHLADNDQNVQGINRWREDAREVFEKNSAKGVCQLERAETGRLHIQGYLEMASRTRLSTMKNKFGPRCHFEKRMGSREAAVKYCMKEATRVKEGGDPLIWGDIQTEFAVSARPLQRYHLSELRGWQSVVYREAQFAELCPPRGYRKIHYVWSTTGGVGKSMFSLIMQDRTDQNCKWISHRYK